MTDIALLPDTDAIARDLEHMTARWHELDAPAVIEIRAFQEGGLPKIGKFNPDDLDEAAEWIEGLNERGYNIYAVRNPVRVTVVGSAKDEDILASFFLWADCDEGQAADNVKQWTGPQYSACVVTGRVPSTRVHTYWELAEPATDLMAWRETQMSIAAHFNSDPSVINPSRIMRVGGTVAYPDAKKQGKGYIKELTALWAEYDPNRKPVTIDQMRRAFNTTTPATAPRATAPMIDTGAYEALDRERTAIQALSGEAWNLAVLKLVGSYVRKGLADSEIQALTGPLTLGGYTAEDTRAEVQGMIDRTRVNPKFGGVVVRAETDAEENDSEWMSELIVNQKGRVLFNTANALLYLQNEDGLRGRFAFDEFRQVKIVTAPLPGSKAPKSNFKGREYKDSDTTQVVAHFNRIGFPEATKNVVADTIDAVSEMSTFHPVRNYLEQLPAWDGVGRIDGWLQDYCNVQADDRDSSDYISEAGAKWLISAVARVMKPGCKADGVLILEGKQGARKSTTLRFLTGEEWFGDSLPSMQSKDASDYLRGKWIIEMAELSNINKAEVEVVKAFISREEERFRPAYARTEITYPRQCVFAGSTNKSDYLRDETGNRRFWPVKVQGLCDTHQIKLDRDQLWAEALGRFKSGETWWLSENVETIAATQQEQRVSQDAWAGDVEQFVAGRSEVSPAEVAKIALGIEIARLDRAATNRITAILTALDFSRKGQFTSGENKGRAKYIRGDEL